MGQATPRRGPAGLGPPRRPKKTRTRASATRKNAASRGNNRRQGNGIGGPNPGDAQERQTAVGPAVHAQSSACTRDVAPWAAKAKPPAHLRGKETAGTPLDGEPSNAHGRQTTTVAQGGRRRREVQPPTGDQMVAGQKATQGTHSASRTAAKRTVRRRPHLDLVPGLESKRPSASRTVCQRMDAQTAFPSRLITHKGMGTETNHSAE